MATCRGPVSIVLSLSKRSLKTTNPSSHFHLNSCVNKQNFRYWSETKPQQVHERPLHSARVTGWCAIALFGVVDPYFFEEGGITVTVTSDRYIEMLEKFLRPQLE